MLEKVIAIDLGATHLRVAVVNKEGKILTKTKQKINQQGSDGKVVVKQIKSEIEPLLGQYKPKAITMGSIGPLQQGTIKEPSNLDFDEVPLQKPLEEKFSLPVRLFNDCQAAVWGENIYGAGQDYNNLMYVTISTGIGGGAIVNGHLLKGANNNAVEVGHHIIEQKYNFQCSCGETGHWEGIASGENLPRFFKAWLQENNKQVDFEPNSAKEILSRAQQKPVKQFTKELGRINARAVSNLITAYNPALITFGGAVALNHPETILKPIKNNVDHFLAEPEMKITPLGEDITLVGAAASYFHPPN